MGDIMMKYILVVSSVKSKVELEFNKLDDIVNYYGLDRYEDFMNEYRKANESEKIELIENELNEFMMPFSPEDDSIARFKIRKISLQEG